MANITRFASGYPRVCVSSTLLPRKASPSFDYSVQSTVFTSLNTPSKVSSSDHTIHSSVCQVYALLNKPLQGSELRLDYIFRLFLEHVGDVHGHLVNLRGVVLLDVSEDAHVVRLDEVDRYTLASESS